MTDGVISQVSLVTPISGTNDAVVNTFAIVAVVSEVPPIAGGARINTFAVVSVSREYTIPQIYVPMPCGQFLQTMPYFIAPFA